MKYIGSVIRPLEEIDESTFQWPFTRNGTILVVVVDTLIIATTVIGLAVCDSVGTCNR